MKYPDIYFRQKFSKQSVSFQTHFVTPVRVPFRPFLPTARRFLPPTKPKQPSAAACPQDQPRPLRLPWNEPTIRPAPRRRPHFQHQQQRTNTVLANRRRRRPSPGRLPPPRRKPPPRPPGSSWTLRPRWTWTWPSRAARLSHTRPWTRCRRPPSSPC